MNFLLHRSVRLGLPMILIPLMLGWIVAEVLLFQRERVRQDHLQALRERLEAIDASASAMASAWSDSGAATGEADVFEAWRAIQEDISGAEELVAEHFPGGPGQSFAGDLEGLRLRVRELVEGHAQWAAARTSDLEMFARVPLMYGTLLLGEELRSVRRDVDGALAESITATTGSLLRAGFAAWVILLAGLWLAWSWRRGPEYFETREQAREREKRRSDLASVTESMDEVMWSVGPEPVPVIHYISPAAKDILGRDAGELQRSPALWNVLIAEEDRAAAREAMDKGARVEAGGWVREFRVHVPGRGTRWMRDRGKAIREASGAILRYQGMMRDVTDEVEERRHLARSEKRFRRMVEAAGAGICALTRDGRIRYANAAFEQLFGTSMRQLENRPLRDFMSDEQRDLFVRRSRDTDANGRALFEIEITRSDGGTRRLQLASTPIRTSDGSLAGSVLVFNDTTRDHGVQTTLISELSFLSEIEILGRAINGQTDVREILANVCGACVAHCGLDHAAIICHSVDSEAPWETAVSTLPYPDDESASGLVQGLAVLRGMTDRVLSSGLTVVMEEDEALLRLGEWEVGRALGLRAVIGTPIRVGDHAAGVLFGFSIESGGGERDRAARLEHLATIAASALSNAWLFDQIRQKNRELEETVGQLRVAERAREEFYRFMIHDLNKPLAAIIGTANRLAGHAEMPEELARRAVRISDAATRLRDIVARLLEYERLRRGEIVAAPGEVQLWPQVHEIASLLAEKHKRCTVTLAGRPLAEADVPHLPDVIVAGDALHVSRIVQNIVDNALKFSDERVEIESETEGEEVILSVWNDGATIEPEDRDRIFSEFFRRGSSRDGGGYGIGLASARHLVENLGGRIWIDSPRGGTRFRVALPLAAGSANPPAAVG